MHIRRETAAINTNKVKQFQLTIKSSFYDKNCIYFRIIPIALE